MSGVRRTAAALRDLDEIELFIARDNPRAADELLGQLQERAALHAGSPLLGSPHAELGNEIRSFVVVVMSHFIFHTGMESSSSLSCTRHAKFRHCS